MDSIQRTKHNGNFTAVNNDFIRDQRLSWKAKGIIIYVMSLPENWNLNLAELKKHAKDGRDATNNGIKELIETGYCKRTEIRDNHGMFSGYDYTISDTPEFLDVEKPDTDLPHTENPFTDNPHLINTNSNNDDNNKRLNEENKENQPKGLFSEIEENIKPKRFIKPTIEQITSYCKERGNNIDAQSFYDYYESVGWKVGNKPMKEWRAAVRTWERNRNQVRKPEQKQLTIDDEFSKYGDQAEFMRQYVAKDRADKEKEFDRILQQNKERKNLNTNNDE